MPTWFTVWTLLLLLNLSSIVSGSLSAMNALQTQIATVAAHVNNTGALTVCIADWAPFVFCQPEFHLPDSYTGFDVEMFRSISKRLGMQEEVDFNFKCIPFSDFESSLTSPQGECDAAIGAITVTNARADLGYKFTYPYYATGLGILVKYDTKQISGWGWLKPFSLSLWIGLILTMILVPLAVFVLEALTLKRRFHCRDIASGVGEAAYRATWTFTGGETFHSDSLPSRITILAFAAMCLILSSTYTANLAAFLTVNSGDSTIQSINDLRGRSAHTLDIYRDEIRIRYGVVTSTEDTAGEQAQRNLADMISNGMLAAALEDAPVMQYIAKNYALSCDLKVLPDLLYPMDYAIAFRFDAEEDLVDAFSAAIIALKETNDMALMKESYISYGTGSCQHSVDSSQSTTSTITLQDVYGLWVILGACVLLSFIIMLGIRRHKKKHNLMYRDDDVEKSGQGMKSWSDRGAAPALK